MAAVWDPDQSSFPTLAELPAIPGAPKDAAWFWGENDNLGRLNLLTPQRTKRAASEEIRTGEIVPVNLPLGVPKVPGFNRQAFEHTIKAVVDGYVYDDTYSMNTQSGTQWDGFRHFSNIPTAKFYNGVTGVDIVGPKANERDSIHYWAKHGIAARGLLLDYHSYAQSQSIDHDPFTPHAISYADLAACGKAQGIDVRPEAQGGHVRIGDILLIRMGWVERYMGADDEERKTVARRGYGDGGAGAARGFDDGGAKVETRPETEKQTWAGIKGDDEELRRWIHDGYFAAIGGDAPSLEVWPKQSESHLHESILPLWGMPLGEMLDLERLSETCKRLGRWTFFFTSCPANCVGGVASHVNGMAFF